MGFRVLNANRTWYDGECASTTWGGCHCHPRRSSVLRKNR